MSKPTASPTLDDKGGATDYDGTPPTVITTSLSDEKRGTAQDVEDMKRMGKEQLFKVFSICSFNPGVAL